MANYDHEVEGNASFIPFNINIPSSWLSDTGNTGCFWHNGSVMSYVYVRGFTGFTEIQCICNHIPTGGAWFHIGWPKSTSNYETTLVPYSSTTSAITVYVNMPLKGGDDNRKVYGRIEVYWPGAWQKEIKYSKAVTLCGHGAAGVGYRTDRVAYRNLPNVIDVTLGGQHMSKRYTTYGGCMDTYMDIRRNLTAATPQYVADVYHNRLIMMDATGTSVNDNHVKTGQTMYNVLRKSGSTLTSSILVTTSPTPVESEKMQYRTVAEVGAFKNSLITCTSDNYNNVCGCDSYCSHCTSDDCEDCNDFCYSESGCYGNCSTYCGDWECDYNSCNDTCYDCGSHSCEINYGEYCYCENADSVPDCTTDSMPVKNCIRTDVGCMYTLTNMSNGYRDYLYMDLSKQVPLTSIRVRMEGAIIRENRDEVFRLGSGNTEANYFRLCVSGQTNGHLKGCVSASTSMPTTASYYKELSTIVLNQDFDITVGNGYIYDNNISANVYTGVTYSNQIRLQRFFINFQAFRLKRVRVYDGDELVDDLTPASIICPTSNDGSLDEYGGFTWIIHDSVTNLDHSISPSHSIRACPPACATVLEGPLDYVSGGTNIIVPIQNNLTSSAITFRFEGAFLNFNGTGPFLGLTGSTIADTTGNRHIVAYFDGTMSGSNARLYFNYNRKYSGTYYRDWLRGVSLGADVDLTFSLGQIVNNNGGAVIYTSDTTIDSTYRKVTKYFFVDIWCLKVYRFRVYSNGNLAYDGTPYWKYENGAITCGLYDSVTNTFKGSESINGPGKWDFWTCGGSTGVTYQFKLMSNDAVYYVQNYAPGETIDMTAFTNPTLACHTFTGWSPLLPTTMPESDFISVAQYTVNSHTIIYYLKDGEHGSSQYVQYSSQTYNCGDTIVPPTVTPGSGWEFTGWSLSGHTTMPDQNLLSYGDVIVYVPSYRIRFYSGYTSWGSTSCNSLVKTEYYHSGDTISYPSIGMYCMNTTGWRTSCDGGSAAPSKMPGNNLDVYLNYHYNMFNVYWKAGIYGSGSYTTYRTDEAEHGDRIYYSNGPDLTNSAPNGYEWGGWPSGSEAISCSDTTIYSYFYETAVTYYNINYYAGGEFYTSVSYPEGATVTPIAVPTDPNGCKTYGNWQGVPSTMPGYDISVSSSSSKTVYTAAYYINHWNGGTELYATYQAEANEGQGVYLPQNDGYSYTPWQDGSSWYPYMPCSDASAYTTESRNQYIATFYKEDGTYFSTYTGYYGDTIVRPTPYTKSGCTVEWPSSPENFPASNVSIYAIEVCPTRTAYFYRADGTSMGTDTGLQGETITYPSLYTKTGYDVAWPSDAPTTFGSGNVTITAVETVHTWTAYWYAANGTTILTTQQYQYGATIVAPSYPATCVWDTYPSTMPDSNIYIYPVCNYSSTFNVQYAIDPSIGSFSFADVSFTVYGGGTTLLSTSFRVYNNDGYEAFTVSWPASLGTYVSCTVSGGITVAGAQTTYQSQYAPNSVNLSNGITNSMTIWASLNN